MGDLMGDLVGGGGFQRFSINFFIISEFFKSNGGYLRSNQYKAVLSNNLDAEVVRLLNSLSGS